MQPSSGFLSTLDAGKLILLLVSRDEEAPYTWCSLFHLSATSITTSGFCCRRLVVLLKSVLLMGSWLEVPKHILRATLKVNIHHHSLTVKSLAVYEILLRLCLVFITLLLLVESWDVFRISVFDSCDSVSPATFDAPFSLPHKNVVLFKLVVIVELFLDIVQFLPFHLWRSQSLWHVLVEQHVFGFA